MSAQLTMSWHRFDGTEVAVRYRLAPELEVIVVLDGHGRLVHLSDDELETCCLDVACHVHMQEAR